MKSFDKNAEVSTLINNNIISMTAINKPLNHIENETCICLACKQENLKTDEENKTVLIGASTCITNKRSLDEINLNLNFESPRMNEMVIQTGSPLQVYRYGISRAHTQISEE